MADGVCGLLVSQITPAEVLSLSDIMKKKHRSTSRPLFPNNVREFLKLSSIDDTACAYAGAEALPQYSL